MAYIARTLRRKGVQQAKIGGGFKPAGIKKIAIAKPKVMKIAKLPGYFGKGHAF